MLHAGTFDVNYSHRCFFLFLRRHFYFLLLIFSLFRLVLHYCAVLSGGSVGAVVGGLAVLLGEAVIIPLAAALISFVLAAALVWVAAVVMHL